MQDMSPTDQMIFQQEMFAGGVFPPQGPNPYGIGMFQHSTGLEFDMDQVRSSVCV